MGNPNLLPYETIVRATSGEPEAVDEIAGRQAACRRGRRGPDRHYPGSPAVRLAGLMFPAKSPRGLPPQAGAAGKEVLDP